MTKSEIKPTDYEWTEYILDQFHEEEIFEGTPKIDGLRRLLEKNISRIVEMTSNIRMYEMGSSLVAVATATIRLENGETYSASSDASRFNTMPAFRDRLSATADTRAKTKAMREALRLRNVVSQDDLGIESGDPDEQLPIDSTQQYIIEKFLKNDKEYDFEKLAAECEIEKEDLRDLQFGEATCLIKQIGHIKKERAK